MAEPVVSICMATFNRHKLLANTLESIRTQKVDESYYEIIVADDGSADDTPAVCREYDVRYTHLDAPEYRNPSCARNAAYRMAKGSIVIAQSDDTMHITEDAILRLSKIAPHHFNIATVWDLDADGRVNKQFTGNVNRAPFFFLGSLRRSDLYAVGGDDEDFRAPGFDDNWMADRLVHGLDLHPDFREDVTGNHQWHARPGQKKAMAWFDTARALYRSKVSEARRTGEWVSSSGPWEMQR